MMVKIDQNHELFRFEKGIRYVNNGILMNNDYDTMRKLLYYYLNGVLFIFLLWKFFVCSEWI